MGAKRPFFGRGLYQITQHATGDDVFFRDRLDYEAMLENLVKSAPRHDVKILDYCLMPNHTHFLLKINRPNLQQLMQQLFARHVTRFNARHGRQGHLVREPYRVTVIKDEAHHFRTRRYIALNPVRAGLCTHPDEWPWCGFSGDGAIAPKPSEALRRAVDRATGRRRASDA